MCEKISLTADPSLGADEAYLLFAHPSGRVEKHVAHAIGSLQVPMTDEQLAKKFVD